MVQVKSVKAPAEMGRPTKLTPEIIKQARMLAGLGTTLERMAAFFGVNNETVILWKKNKDFSDALKKGAEELVAEVAKSLFLKATKGNDTTAMIFFLKNRAPDLWKDRREEKVEHTIGAPSWSENRTVIRTREEEQGIIDAAKRLEHKRKGN